MENNWWKYEMAFTSLIYYEPLKLLYREWKVQVPLKYYLFVMSKEGGADI